MSWAAAPCRAVFVANEVALDRRVVVKVLPEQMAGQVSLERFKREIALTTRSRTTGRDRAGV